jgi:hypothetical protein
MPRHSAPIGWWQVVRPPHSLAHFGARMQPSAATLAKWSEDFIDASIPCFVAYGTAFRGRAMNIKRGLFRIWVVLSILYIIVLTLFAIDYASREFEQQAEVNNILTGKISKGMPVDCTKAKEFPQWWAQFPHADDGLCWASLPEARKIHPELTDPSDLAFAETLYAGANKHLWVPTPWWTVASFVGWAIGLPLAVLAIGSAIYWALAGFARPKPER